MSDVETKRQGGRVFRIDRECYVLYVGSENHRVRPFLRVGTSPALPDRLRPYIGTVVLTDRITGNPLEEAETVGAVGPRRPEYTGTPALVHAFSPLTGIRRVSERPIKREEPKRPEGAFVEFLTDGNLHLRVNGHKIYDLDNHEQSDRHDAYRLERVAGIAGEPEAAYHHDTLAGEGFWVGRDRSVYRFRDGVFRAQALRAGALLDLAQRLIDPRVLQVLEGPADPSELLLWAKWHLRRHLTKGESTELTLVSRGGKGTEKNRLDHLVDVLATAGLNLSFAVDAPHLPAGPTVPVSDEGIVLRVDGRGEWPEARGIVLPDGERWAEDRQVPLVPGVPYRVHSQSEPSAQGLMSPGKAGRTRDDAYGRLLALLDDWNTGALKSDDAEPEQFARTASELLKACPAPVVADLYPTEQGYTARFFLQHGFTLKRARENVRAVERINALYTDEAAEEFFRAERRRLLALLDELLSQRKATTRAPQREQSAEVTEETHNETDDVRSAEDATVATQETDGPSRDPGSSVGESTASSGAASGGRSETRRGALAGVAVLGFVVIAGVVALLLLREDTGEVMVAGLDDPPAVSAPADEPGAAQPDDAEALSAETADEAQGDQDTLGDGESTSADAADQQSEDALNSIDPSADNLNGEIGAGVIEISLSEILALVNRIARDNGYAAIGAFDPEARDPDWIFPGNRLQLPDAEVYVIEGGDTMWGIADRFLRTTAERHHAMLTRVVQRMENGERPIDELEQVIDDAYLESTRRRARQLIEELGV